MKRFRIVFAGHVPVRGYTYVDASDREVAEEVAKSLDESLIDHAPVGSARFDEVLEVQEVWDE